MKKIIHLFICICLSGFIACKKDSVKTDVTGIVVNTGSTTAVAGALVELLQTDANCIACQGSSILNTTSDSKGGFTFNFKAQAGYNYTIKASKNLYYNNAGSGGVAVNNGQKNNITVSITPYAWLMLHVKNVSPFGGGDQIGIGGLSGSPIQLFGSNIDTVFTGLPVNGSTSVSIYWTVIKNNVTNTYSDNKYCPAFDTTAYTINY